MAADLTTTSYAILGLLAIKPWTTYELAQQMGRALGQFWPRAESKLYEEPKKLVAHGLAKAAQETVGKRRRTVYSITPKGRKALAKWIPEPGAGPSVEFEALIKVFFAEHGSKTDLLATLAGVRGAALDQALKGAGLSEAYLEGKGQFPQRLPWLILIGRFLADFVTMVDTWATWATDIVEAWPDDIREAEPDWSTLEQLAEDNEAYVARAALTGGAGGE